MQPSAHFVPSRRPLEFLLAVSPPRCRCSVVIVMVSAWEGFRRGALGLQAGTVPDVGVAGARVPLCSQGAQVLAPCDVRVGVLLVRVAAPLPLERVVAGARIARAAAFPRRWMIVLRKYWSPPVLLRR